MKFILLLTMILTLPVLSKEMRKKELPLRKNIKKTSVGIKDWGKLNLSELLKKIRCRHTSTMFKCVEAIRNYDGDTITVNIPDIHPFFGEEISVRVNGVDTAEIRTSDECEKQMAEEAKEYVENEIMNAKTIHLAEIERDKYFRIGAKVLVDGEDLAQKLLEENLAYPYDGSGKPEVNWCEPLDEQFDMELN